MTSPLCSKCGFTNLDGVSYCAKCGSPLQPTPPSLSQPQVARPPGLYPSAASTYAYDYASGQKRTQVDRTKTGLLLLIIGIVLAPVPFIGAIGGILALIGAIMVILGRDAFGRPHSNYTIWSVILYVVGFVVIFASGVTFGFSIATAALGTSGATISDTLTAAIDNLLIGIIIGGAITGFGTVLFTYALQETIGRVLLWIGYASALVVGVLIFSVVGANIGQVVQQSLSGGVFNPAPINDLQARLRVLQLLNFVPALINASAYYRAWSRVNKGELPGESAARGPGGISTISVSR